MADAWCDFVSYYDDIRLLPDNQNYEATSLCSISCDTTLRGVSPSYMIQGQCHRALALRISHTYTSHMPQFELY